MKNSEARVSSSEQTVEMKSLQGKVGVERHRSGNEIQRAAGGTVIGHDQPAIVQSHRALRIGEQRRADHHLSEVLNEQRSRPAGKVAAADAKCAAVLENAINGHGSAGTGLIGDDDIAAGEHVRAGSDEQRAAIGLTNRQITHRQRMSAARQSQRGRPSRH